MKKTLFSILFLIVLFSFKTNQEVKKYNSFYFVYVENTKLPGKEALSLSQKAKISACIRSVKDLKEVKFFLFVADGEKPTVVEDPTKTEEVIENLYTKQYKLPEFTEDKKTIRKLIADKPFGVKDTISINYILSDNYIHDYLLSKEPGELLNLFPRELGYLLSVSSNQIMVNLYYSNANKLFDEKSLKKTIEFFNKDDFKLLNYKLIKI